MSEGRILIEDDMAEHAGDEMMLEKPDLPIKFAEEPESVLARFPGLARKRFTDEQKAILEQKIPPDDIDILPTGELYVSQVRYRRILNDAFGPGGWGLIPTGDFQQDAGTLCREYSLFAEGRFIASAIGEADFQPNNPRYSKATASESLKSNALTRCCKDLCIASECWDKRFCEKWKKEFAVAVWCVGVANDIKGKKKKLWRRKDADPFEYPWAEQGQPPKPPEPPEDVPAVDLRADTPALPPTQMEIGLPGASQTAKTAIQTAAEEKRAKFLVEMKKLEAAVPPEIFHAAIGLAGYSSPEEITDSKTMTEVYRALKKQVLAAPGPEKAR